MTKGWLCVESCPVRLLDEMSGERPAGYRKNPSKAYRGDVVSTNFKQDYVDGERGYKDSGGASKYFQTFPPETEDNLIEPVQQADVQILQGDCLTRLKELPDNSIDSCITDPPYGLSKEPDIAEVMKHWLEGDDYLHTSKGFMGKSWDSFVPGPRYWKEVYRVMKPGAHLLCFSGTRTWDLVSMALRFAGFENRDTISNEGAPALRWVYGSGFPKSANVEKLLTKRQGQKRRAHGMVPLEAPQSARMHSGIGSAIKPAWEVILVFRKPLEGSIAQNILKHGEWLGTVYKVGTGGLNIDASRVGGELEGDPNRFKKTKPFGSETTYAQDKYSMETEMNPVVRSSGRFPSNTLWSHVPGPNGCVRVGSRRVKPGNGSGTAKGQDKRPLKRSIYGSTDTLQQDSGFVDPDGLEEVPEYICEKSCPIKALDEMSGVRDSGGPGRGGVYEDQPGGWPGGQRTVTGYQDKGGASRFFVNFSPDPNPGFFRCEICDTYGPKHAIMSECNDQQNGANQSPANIAEKNSRLSTDKGDSALSDAQVRQPLLSGGSNQSESKSAHNAENGSGRTPATIKSTAPQNAWDSLVGQNAQSVESVASLCKRCTTAIAQSLARWQYDQSPEFLAGLDSIPEHKRQTLRQSLVLFAETLANTGTIPTTQSLKMFFGYVRDAMRHSTPIEETGNGQHPVASEYREINTGWGGFYCPKASRAERNRGLEGMPEKQNYRNYGSIQDGRPHTAPDYKYKATTQNTHPTVKPVKLLSYLVKLVTPPNGTVLDCFAGSGTTGVAALSEGFNAILIEQDESYVEIAERRCAHALRERVEPEKNGKPKLVESGNSTLF